MVEVVERQQDVRSEQLVLVEVGRSMFQFFKYVGLTGGISMVLLVRTESRTCTRPCMSSLWSAVRTANRTWTGCCIARTCRGRG